MNILGEHRGYKKLVSLNYGMCQVKLLQNVRKYSVKREQDKNCQNFIVPNKKYILRQFDIHRF
jgi:hypothetical protein